MVKSCLVICLINYFNNKQPSVDNSENPAQLPRNFLLSVKKWQSNFYSVSIILFDIVLPVFLCRQRREVRPNISSNTCVVFVILWLFYTCHHINRVGPFREQIWAPELFLSVATCPLLKIFVQESSACSQARPGCRVDGVLTGTGCCYNRGTTLLWQLFHQILPGFPTSTES